ncbi:UDP-N-acetylglucosamine 2-epimerase (non-hydrolyzing) [Natrarchaeobaculum aegyptiacum]|uniref:UDP-N-acetylglucosamine 2-epimerase (Non-hydrolyzing) n=2 Tax=Natrarchaeobaculum aegyptiacum TaxID=745377 RepID=A0A2Z2HX05_9EURY|nr:UDP-N-acetylglucosamine 2-epimerase (non-hydrolyzing) [Natrarchaeobaculum aegyptiacum]
MGTKLAIVLGTRPEIIKLSPLLRACTESRLPHTVIHTGQHYTESLDAVFFDQLELREPDHHLAVGSGTHAEQTAEMMVGIEQVLLEEQPDVVLVQGDTNSVLAGTMATSKLEIDLGHVEAGLRSFDRTMPEETNRVIADHTAEYLFAPTPQSRTHLLEEGIDRDRIYVTGNTVVDAVDQNRELAAAKSTVLPDLDLEPGAFGLMTAHRAENVDDAERFAGILEGADRVATQFGIEIVYPIHPRAEEAIDTFGLEVPDGVRVIEPQDYLDFLVLQDEASVVLTDSGGIQEEACILGVPCVTLRDNTERPETVDVGANRLAGTDPDSILDRTLETVDDVGNWENPFGDGKATDRILEPLLETPVQEVAQ